MRRHAEFLLLLWLCKSCDYANRVSLRKREKEDFPSHAEYFMHKPYACYHCGDHGNFELRDSRIIERVIEANGT